jgi:hypothetical protein
MPETSPSNPTPDWRPQGPYLPDYFKVKAPASPQRPPAPSRPISVKVRRQPAADVPIPNASLGDNVVVVLGIVRSNADKRVQGLWRAIEDKSTRPVCFAFQFGPHTIIWTPSPVPAATVSNAIMVHGDCPAIIADAVAHGATFLCNTLAVDRQMYRKLGWPEPVRWMEMSAVLAAANYHRSIDRSGEVVLGVAPPAGQRAFLQSLWSRKGAPVSTDTATNAIRLAMRRTRLIAALAVRVGCDLGTDKANWELDVAINEGGTRADNDLVLACVKMQKKLASEVAKYAEGLIRELPGKVSGYRAALQVLGFSILNTKVHTLKQALLKATEGDNLHAQILLVALLSASQRATTSKFEKIVRQICADGCLRGLYFYQQARTGRWSK